jgi:leucyl-tRNA---protein transferase
MTRDISPDIQTVRLCLTEPHECSYLPERMSTTAFVDPALFIDVALYSRMTTLGFRRSGPYLYAPMCSACKACVPTRLPVAEFKMNRSQKRCWRDNADIAVEQCDAIDLAEHYDLYARYIESRHSDGDMYPPSVRQFEDFLGKPWECTQFLEFRVDNKLIGCAVVDLIDNALSAIYTYFDPDHSERGLGNLAVLFQIQLAQRLGLKYLYLGYWISGCNKMQYKTNYQPLELYRENNWLKAD